jgi:hypothetical protein
VFFGYFNFNPFSFMAPSTNVGVLNQTQTQNAINVSVYSWGVQQGAQNVGYQTAVIYQR